MQMETKIEFDISDKINFNSKSVIRDKEGNYNIDKGDNSRRYNNFKNIFTQHENTQTY